MLRMIYDSINVLSFLEENNIKHSEINPNLIFLFNKHHKANFDSDSNSITRVKICERLNGNPDSIINNFNALNQKLDVYLSPKKYAIV